MIADTQYGILMGAYLTEHGSTITVSGSCYPDYKASMIGDMDCATLHKKGACDASFHMSLRWAEQKDDGSWVTFLHCPECSCSTTGFPNFKDLAAAEKY